MGKIKLRKKIPIIQIGSLIQQGHGENISNHGYGVYDIKKDEYKYHNMNNPKPFLKFKINSFDDILDSKEILLNA